jgi:PAS domain-containing protein
MATPEQTGQSTSEQVSDLFDALDVTKAIDTGEFRIFLDHLPIAIVISKAIEGEQRIVFANHAYATITGQPVEEVVGRRWHALDLFTLEDEPHTPLSRTLTAGEDFCGTFRREKPKPILVEAYSGWIENEDGTVRACLSVPPRPSLSLISKRHRPVSS